MDDNRRKHSFIEPSIDPLTMNLAPPSEVSSLTQSRRQVQSIASEIDVDSAFEADLRAPSTIRHLYAVESGLAAHASAG